MSLIIHVSYYNVCMNKKLIKITMIENKDNLFSQFATVPVKIKE